MHPNGLSVALFTPANIWKPLCVHQQKMGCVEILERRTHTHTHTRAKENGAHTHTAKENGAHTHTAKKMKVLHTH